MAYLIQSGKDNQVKIIRLEGPCVTIGRNPAHDVALTDPFLSRDHAEILCLDDKTFEIRDLGAKSPVKINGEIISKHKLKAGDKILLGHTEFVFRTDEASCVELLPPEEMEQESVEVTSVDAKKTFTFSKEDLDSKDLVSLHKDHQRLMLLYELGKTVNSHLEDPHYLLDEIMNTAFKMLNAERGFIALVDESTGKLTCELVRDVTADKEPEKLEVSRTIVHKVLSDRVSIMTVNAQKDSEFKKIKSVQDYNIRSALCAPLLSHGEVLGVVYLDNRAASGSFSQDDLMFLVSMCHQAGIALGNAYLHRNIAQENVRLEKALRTDYEILGDSKQMKSVYLTMKKVAPADITVLLEGETGTGKELIARAIHALSPRGDLPYVAVNCAAIPKELIESELFGHEKGAFTGATSARQGKFQMAHQGTIFLDEIGDMSLDTQAKVLRVLEQKEVQKVGGTGLIKVDVRILAATNKDLKKAVQEERFREDLYYRLNVVAIQLPPLRDRKSDILTLAEHFIAGRAKKISMEAQRLLLAYEWPGNVRELKNYMDRAVVLGAGDIIQSEDLPHHLRLQKKEISSPLEPLDQIEEDHVIRVLRHTGWHKSDAARILGITRQTLDNKIEKYSLEK